MEYLAKKEMEFERKLAKSSKSYDSDWTPYGGKPQGKGNGWHKWKPYNPKNQNKGNGKGSPQGAWNKQWRRKSIFKVKFFVTLLRGSSGLLLNKLDG